MHPRDVRVCVQTRPRCVTVDGAPVFHAATTLVKEFGDEFDAKATVARMQRDGPWPAAGYALGAETVHELDPTRPTQTGRRQSRRGPRRHP